MNKTLQEFNKKNLNRYTLSCDWLQIHCTHSESWLSLERPDVLIKKTGQSKMFKAIYDIISLPSKKVVAVYATEANECILGKNHGILKIDNKQLYINPDLKGWVIKLLKKLDFTFIGITRLDIAYDFHKFYNNREPENFIKGYLRNDLVKCCSTHYKTAGKEKQTVKNFQYLAFGANTSIVNYKLYNKTQEQAEVIRKPYIWDYWKQYSTLNLGETIWRLEFSVKSSTSTLKNDFKNFKYHSLETLEFPNLYGLYIELYNRYFQFVNHDRKQSRKDRMKKITLIEFEAPELRLTMEKKGNEVTKNSTRSTKIFLKHLHGLDHELREFDENFSENAKDMISKLIDLYNLQEWAKNKGIEYVETNYANNINDYQNLNNE